MLFDRLVAREIVENTVGSPSIILLHRSRKVNFGQEVEKAHLRPLRPAVKVILADSLPGANLITVDDIAVLLLLQRPAVNILNDPRAHL
jgi:hypothetical protein